MQQIPCEPVRLEYGHPVYSSDQIKLFGPPDTWGVHDYTVLDGDPEYVIGYSYSLDREPIVVHRYSRVQRFESVLYQLLAHRGRVPTEVIEEIRVIGVDPRPEYIWDSVRELLKHFGWRQYYNRIPVIIQRLGLRMRIDLGDDRVLVDEILAEFKRIHILFEEVRGVRKYFPNLRYVALKLLRAFGADFGFRVPLLRTKRKLPLMEKFWDKIMTVVDDNRYFPQ